MSPLTLRTYLPWLALAGWAATASAALPPDEQRHAFACFYRGEYAQAEEEYRQLIERNGRDRDLARDLAAVRMADGRYAEAVEVLQHAGIQGMELGEARMAMGDFNAAAREFKRDLEYPGLHARTRTLLGFLAALQGRQAEAAQHYWQALEENPKLATVHLLLARAFSALAQEGSAEADYFRQRAREEYQTAIKIDASLWLVHRDLALLAEADGRIDEALSRWERVRYVVGDTDEVNEAIHRLVRRVPTPTPERQPSGGSALVWSSGPRAVSVRSLHVHPLGNAGDPVIRVGLGSRLTSLAFACGGEWRARDSRGQRLWKGLAHAGYRIERDPNGGWALKTWERRILKRFARPVTLESLDPQEVFAIINLYQDDGYMWGGGVRSTHYYRGQLLVQPNDQRLKLINKVFLEDYLVSVVPSEMDADWPKEALRAQAIVARTDTLNRRGAHNSEGFDVCSSAHCAAYEGVGAEAPQTLEAIYTTRGEVLMKADRLLPTFYSHACGGLTQTYEEAWTNQFDPLVPGGVVDGPADSRTAYALPLRPGELGPFLARRTLIYCNNPLYAGEHSYRWFKVLTNEELSAVLDRRFGVGRIRTVKVLERGPSGYIRKIYIEGDRGSTLVQGDMIRSSVGGLRSNLFMLIPIPAVGHPEASPQAWMVWGGGWGHGVGLCQAGAAEMGHEGFSYAEILKHYFPQGEVQEWR